VLPQVETMTKLAHENVAQIYTKLEEHGCTYLVMEIIGGGELFDTARLPSLCPYA
jgi:serine/threonine protein kinase